MKELMNKKSVGPQALKGFRDFLPEQMAVRKKVKQIFVEVFESFGFEPVETPSLEYQSVLLGKYGKEADKLVYCFNDKGGRPVGLRYDLTVPLARIASQYQAKLPTPFKRYQIQRVWRADKPQKGRYREIEMCDVDILNSLSPLADAEILLVINTVLEKLVFDNFIIRINSRQVLFSLISQSKIGNDLRFPVIQSIDKLDKIPQAEVEKELSQKGLNYQQIKTLFQNFKLVKPDAYLKEVIDASFSFGIPRKRLKFDPSLARGLDYYTGPIFETVVDEPKIGSITGGGRYDQLIKQLGGPDWPAVGTTLGLDRICDVILANKLWPQDICSVSKVLVSIFKPEFLPASLKLIQYLRQQKIKAEIYLNPKTKLDKQLKYADRKAIPYVAILGPDEIKQNKATVKNLKNGKQQTVNYAKLVQLLH